MTADAVLATLWRRRLLFVAVLVACMAAVVTATYALPKTYKATATLFVGVNDRVNEALAFDTALGEQLARTYTTLAANPNVAEDVRGRLPFTISRSALLSKVAFAPVERTQLLEITAEDRMPERAQLLADTYAQTFKQRVDGQVGRGATQTRVAVSEPASQPTKAAKPNPPLYLGFGAVLSVLLALGVVLLRERLDDRLPITEAQTEVLEHPVRARIPEVDWERPEARMRMDDAFELLRANIDFVSEHRVEVVLVTSPSPRDGKSSVALELTTTYLRHGDRSVLIEADLRRPGVSATAVGAGLEPASTGLTNYLVGGGQSADVITAQPRTGLDVIWAGPLPPNPTSLLQSHRFKRLIEDLRDSYDRIVIDTPPIAVGADASVLASCADAILYVLDARNTRRSGAQTGLRQVETAHGRNIGIVLNRVDDVGAAGYSYHAGLRAEHAAGNGRRRSRLRRSTKTQA